MDKEIIFPEASPQDVCMAETFKAECQTDEVILMEAARYGRMERSRCLNENSGNIGCTSDVLYLMDDWCSGLTRCQFTPVTEFLKIQTMMEWCNEMMSYLEVDYTCVKGIYFYGLYRVSSWHFAITDTFPCKPTWYIICVHSITVVQGGMQCNSHQPIPVGSQEGFISSQVTDKTGCGSPSTPWVIEAKPGQRINVTLVDFGALSMDDDQLHQDCSSVYGYITDNSGSNYTICAQVSRKKLIYHSKSSSIQIRILPGGQRKNDARFLVHYESGCLVSSI